MFFNSQLFTAPKENGIDRKVPKIFGKRKPFHSNPMVKDMKHIYAIFSIGMLMQSNAMAQGEQSILPEGYKVDTLTSGWQKGGSPRIICAGMVAKTYPNKPFQIDSLWEEQKFDNPTFRTNSRYNYHCRVTIKVGD